MVEQYAPKKALLFFLRREKGFGKKNIDVPTMF